MNYAAVPGWMTLSALMAVRALGAGSRLPVGGVSGADLTGAVALECDSVTRVPKRKV